MHVDQSKSKEGSGQCGLEMPEVFLGVELGSRQSGRLAGQTAGAHGWGGAEVQAGWPGGQWEAKQLGL